MDILAIDIWTVWIFFDKIYKAVCQKNAMIVKKVKKMLVEVKDFHLLDSGNILYLTQIKFCHSIEEAVRSNEENKTDCVQIYFAMCHCSAHRVRES